MVQQQSLEVQYQLKQRYSCIFFFIFIFFTHVQPCSTEDLISKVSMWAHKISVTNSASDQLWSIVTISPSVFCGMVLIIIMTMSFGRTVNSEIDLWTFGYKRSSYFDYRRFSVRSVLRLFLKKGRNSLQVFQRYCVHENGSVAQKTQTHNASGNASPVWRNNNNSSHCVHYSVVSYNGECQNRVKTHMDKWIKPVIRLNTLHYITKYINWL